MEEDSEESGSLMKKETHTSLTSQKFTQNFSLEETFNYGEYDRKVASVVKGRYRYEYSRRVFRIHKSKFAKFGKGGRGQATNSRVKPILIKNIDILHFFGVYSKNKHLADMFRSTLFQHLIEDRLIPFMNQLRKEFYVTKEKDVESMLPFMIKFNLEILELAESYTSGEKAEEALVQKMYHFLSIQSYKLKKIKLEKNKLKIFEDEDAFFKSQELLMRKMLLGYKVTQDLKKAKKVVQKREEDLKLQKELKNVKK
jgi:hypothetical protein